MSSFSPRHFGVCVVSIVCLFSAAFAGTFKNPKFIATDYDPVAIATADLNHDGDLDLVYVDGVTPGTLHVLLGRGDGTFSHGQDIALPYGSGNGGWAGSAINIVDVTGDGNLDVLLGGTGSIAAQLLVLVGNGDGSFQAPIVSVLSASSNNTFPLLNGLIGVGDVNGDGIVDLVAADPMNNMLWVALGDKKGKFTLSSTITYYGGIAAYLADLNGDNVLDIVVTDRIGATASVLLGNGNGTFQAAVNYSTGASTQNLLLVDMDRDGHPDIVAETYPGQVVFLKGNPDGTFAAPVTIASVPQTYGLAPPADFNGDGLLDLAFLSSAGVTILPAKSALAFNNPVSSLAGGLGLQGLALLAEGDFNNDGRMDIAMASESGIVFLFGNGNGSFRSADSYDVGSTLGVIVVADFNGDKLPDIAATVAAQYPRVLIGNASGTFTLAHDQNTSYGSQNPSQTLLVGDFNGDGPKDLESVLETTGQGFVLYGVGNGTFQAPVNTSAGQSQAGDLNSDGRTDLVYLSSFYQASSLLGQSNKTFSSVNTDLRTESFALFPLVDLNKDGELDLMVSAYQALQIWLGNGDGTFRFADSIDATGFVSGAVGAVADLNGDGNPDLILLPDAAGSLLSILYGNGDGTFQSPIFVPVSHLYSQIVAVDVNGDNKPDLVMADSGGISMMLNLGSGVFGPEEHFVAGQGITSVNVVDVNGDGYPDIIAANGGGTTVAVLLNQPNGTPPGGAVSYGVFTASPQPSNYAQPITLSITVSASGSNPTPTGTVSFSLDGAFVTNVSLVSGQASYMDTLTVTAGSHVFVATYSGDNIYGAESFAVLHTVNEPVYPTKTTLVAKPTSVFTSQTVRLRATVTSTPPGAGGVITFLDGTSTLYGQQTDSNGVALFDTALLEAGTHHLTALFQGTSGPNQPTYSPSTSASVTVSVSSTPTTTVVSTSSTSLTAGTVVTFTANVNSATGIPFGGISFYDGNAILGSSSVKADGSSSFSTASLSVGTHSITAAFNANANYAGSASQPLSVTINAAEASLVATIVSLDLASSSDANNSLLVAKVGTSVGSPMGTVTFMDSGIVLGLAKVDPSGTASLHVALGSGIHKLSASFLASGSFAPSASPDLLEQWPASGAGFVLNIGSKSVTLTMEPSIFPVSVVAQQGFQQEVRLSCTNLTLGYACSFMPDSLQGGGSSLASIQRTAVVRKGITKEPRNTPAWEFAFFVLVGSASVRSASWRLKRHLMLLVLVFSFVVLTSCGVSPSAQVQQMGIATIQSTSGQGASAIIHSAQIELKLAISESDSVISSDGIAKALRH